MNKEQIEKLVKATLKKLARKRYVASYPTQPVYWEGIEEDIAREANLPRNDAFHDVTESILNLKGWLSERPRMQDVVGKKWHLKQQLKRRQRFLITELNELIRKCPFSNITEITKNEYVINDSLQREWHIYGDCINASTDGSISLVEFQAERSEPKYLLKSCELGKEFFPHTKTGRLNALAAYEQAVKGISKK